MGEPTVIVRFDADGELTYHASSGVDLFIVDERTPGDRVYQWTTRTSAQGIAKILGGDPVGSQHDERHAAISARIIAAHDGRPHLSIVEDDA